LSVSAAVANAQQTIASASVSGTVTDASDLVLDGAGGGLGNRDTQQTGGDLVVGGGGGRLVNRDTNQTVDTVADTHGRFRFVYVPVGSYQLSATAPGLATVRVDVVLGVGQSLDVPLHLTTATATESVDVTASAPLVEAGRTPIAEIVSPQE